MVPKYHLNASPEPVILRDRYEPEVQTDLALGWLEQKVSASEAFCLFLSYGPPHGPYRPVPPDYESAYDPAALFVRPNCADTPEERRDLADYYAHATAVDAQIGRLVDFLRERGVLDDTLVVYTSDHGTMLGSQGHHNKQQPWEESINVPLVMRFGDRLPRGARPDLLISALDYAPTLLGLLGVEVPAAMEGRNLAGHLTGRADEPAPDSVYIGEMVCCDQAVRENLVPWRGVRTKRHTYARSVEGPWVLYDNEEDPYQLDNLVGDEGLREALEVELQRWLSRMDDEVVPADALLGRMGLSEAWAAREQHFHPRGWPPKAAPSLP
jgi:arylsulfatase A-like enzyme